MHEKVGPPINLRITETLQRAIEKISKREQRSKAFIARRLIQRGLDAERLSRPTEPQP